MAEQIFAGLVIAIVMFFVGRFFQRKTDNKKIKNDFYSEDYKDILRVVQNVDGVIKRNRKVRDEKVMEPIKDKYSCGDIHVYLETLVRTDDGELKQLLKRFSKNLAEYKRRIARLDFPSMGDKKIDFKGISKELTNNIQSKINEHLEI